MDSSIPIDIDSALDELERLEEIENAKLVSATNQVKSENKINNKNLDENLFDYSDFEIKKNEDSDETKIKNDQNEKLDKLKADIAKLYENIKLNTNNDVNIEQQSKEAVVLINNEIIENDLDLNLKKTESESFEAKSDLLINLENNDFDGNIGLNLKENRLQVDEKKSEVDILLSEMDEIKPVIETNIILADNISSEASNVDIENNEDVNINEQVKADLIEQIEKKILEDEACLVQIEKKLDDLVDLQSVFKNRFVKDDEAEEHVDLEENVKVDLIENNYEINVIQQNDDTENQEEKVVVTVDNQITDVEFLSNENDLTESSDNVAAEAPVETNLEDSQNKNNIVDDLIIDVNEISHNPVIIDDLLNNLNENVTQEATNVNLVENEKSNIEDKTVLKNENSEIVTADTPTTSTAVEGAAAVVVEAGDVTQNQNTHLNRELDELKAQLNAFTDDQKLLGIVAPVWIPDPEMSECMKCNTKFTFTKRRHHCRGCGLLFCSTCCNLRLNLQYNTKEQSRVCNLCFDTIHKINDLKKKIEDISARPESTIVSVLKKDGKRRTSELNNDDSSQLNVVNNAVGATASASVVKSVRFSDGIAPGCDLAEEEDNERNNTASAPNNASSSQKISKTKSSRNKKLSRNKALNSKLLSLQIKLYEQELISKLKLNLIQNDNILSSLCLKDNGTDDENGLLEKIKDADSDPITFVLLKHLKVHVKIINLFCCINKPCWVFVTQGFCTIGQDELVYIIECYNENDSIKDDKIPKQIFVHILDIYSKVTKGQLINSMNYSLYQGNPPSSSSSSLSNRDHTDKSYFLDNKDNAGFIYFQPSKYNCLKNLESILPNNPYLIGLLVQKWEIPWAKLFPLRLLLLLGAEVKVFPYPIISSRLRRAYCGEIGHTIMNLLCDLRNYQYSIPQIDGLYITFENNIASIQIPQSQYNLIMKSILTSNDYVFSMASLNLNDACTSHLVAIENENSNSYTSRKISAPESNTTNKEITGAGFVVFNGSLKSAVNPNINAKLSIVEDGIMIQIDTETMQKLKQALQAMKPYRIECNKTQNENESNEVISLEWYKEDKYINRNVYSVIDNKPFCGIKSIRLFQNSYDYMNDTKLIRLTEIFLIRVVEDTNSVIDTNFNLNRFVDSCSQAFCLALITLLDELVNETSLINNSNEKNLFKLALRITVSRDIVEYQIGANGLQINDEKYLCGLDNELIPILHQANAYNIDICLEFIFYVLDRYVIDNNHENINKSMRSTASSSSSSQRFDDNDVVNS